MQSGVGSDPVLAQIMISALFKSIIFLRKKSQTVTQAGKVSKGGKNLSYHPSDL